MTRGVLLLEVVVALTIVVAAIGLLGAELVSGLDITSYAEEQLRASELADEVLGLVQLDPQMQRRVAEGGLDGVEDKFGDAYPGYFWRVNVEPVDRERQDIGLVTIEVLYQRDPKRPEEIKDAQVLRTLKFLKASPAQLDLTTDLGLNEQALDQLRQLIPIENFDPHAVDLHQLVALDPQTMMALLPMLTSLMQQFGGGQGGSASDLQGLLGQLAQGDPGAAAAGGEAGLLQDLGNLQNLQNLQGGQGLPPEAAAGLAELIRLRAQAASNQQPSNPEEGGMNPGPFPGSGRRPAGAPGAAGGAGLPPARRGGGPGGPGGIGPGGPGGRGAGGPGSRGTGGPGGRGAGGPGGGARPGGRPITGSGASGGYTVEDLIRMRDEYQRQQGGGK